MNGSFGMISGGIGPKMCLNCRTRPAYQNYDHCGKTCAAQAKNNPPAAAAPGWGQAPPPGGLAPGWGYGNYGPPAGPPPQQQGPWPGYGQYQQGPQQAPGQMMCQNCQMKPAFSGYQYCSKTCGANAKKGAGSPPMPPQQYGPPAGYGGYSPPQQQGSWPSGPPPAWGPNPQQGGQWQGGGQSWGPPQRNRNQGRPSRRQGRRTGRYDEDSSDDDDWPYGSAQQQYPAPQPAYPSSQPYYNPMPWPAPPPPPAGRPCAIPGCKAMAFSPTSRYCGQGCRKDAVTKGLEPACLFCKVYPKGFKSHYCSMKCGQTAENQGPMLLDVPLNDPKFADIVKQFNDTWKGGYGSKPAPGGGVAAPGNPTIKRVCKVVNSKAVEARYQAYRKLVEAKGNFAAQGKPEGNECRRWHGTQRICTVGDTATNLNLCANAACRLCSIIRVSFQTSSSVCIGNGIYTSAFSGVSNGYTRAQSAGSPYKAMFLTRTVVGKRHIGGKAPVAGTDSTAVDNMDSELIVFNNDAILPSWLVLYS